MSVQQRARSFAAERVVLAVNASGAGLSALLLDQGRVVMLHGDVGRMVVDKLDRSLWVVELEGEHDLSNVGELRDVLARIFAQGTTVVVDLSAATFLDSSVLSELILAQQRVAGGPGEELAIVAPRDGVAARLIDLVDAGRMFSMFGSRAEALRSIGRRPPGGGEPRRSTLSRR